MPLKPARGERQTDPRVERCLRVLLLSPTATANTNLDATVQRIRHFAALTGGEDLIIVFLLNADPAKHKSIGPSENGMHSASGEHAYAELQAELVNHIEIPYMPVLPVCKIDEIQPLLSNHTAALASPTPVCKPSATPRELLQLCTANPPMATHTANVLTDLFLNIGDLATACSMGSFAIGPGSSSSPGRTIDHASYDMVERGTPRMQDYAARLRTFSELVSDQEWRNIVDFWTNEWVID